ncbi:FKBP-type peptidyl-prolyl cis-trans isomerase [Brevibacterium sp. 91QC2O2]|uniref:FKBP-type peptidyl-prolyl cis-trans isomerase n=1 Tax=Brevibacterium TaxID=1696 RepID=UPI00211BEB37|nr:MULTISPECIES: FKBP-type peptidyl-prolyl cis-trans isomerase [unclassified Brevibacterium]MCQ9366804.1 FKBP-type peptidyl-prolyl cis-trans isomerase [Brevibacterium sp. 91QC2O2]MCQ9383954.1 FKBP-type peptidyl-prolyl cis-trans isomerase [Brevibacterium sp. 68QC2CO]
MRVKLISTLAVLGLVLSGCGGGDKEDNASASQAPAGSAPAQAPAKAKSTSLDQVKVTGAFGKEPKVDFAAPLAIGKSGHKTLSKGKGEAVKDGQQLTVQMSTFSGNTGKKAESTLDQGKPAGFPMDTKQINGDLYKALSGVPVGSRVLFNMQSQIANDDPADDKPATTSSQTVLYVIDVLKAEKQPEVLKRATGSKVAPKAGLPKVTLGKDGKPSISKPSGTKPSKLIVQPTIKGKGAKVTAGQNVTFHYSGWLWDDNTKTFDSSWDKGQPATFQIGVKQLIAGWDEGIVGQRVGSQLLLVVPPDKGYGPSGSSSIPGNSTLVFVIDILAAVG